MLDYPRCYEVLSSIPGDPGYERYTGFMRRGTVPVVYVDGRPVPLAVSADPLSGTVVAFMKDANHAYKRNIKGEFCRRTVQGYVRIDLVPQADL